MLWTVLSIQVRITNFPLKRVTLTPWNDLLSINHFFDLIHSETVLEHWNVTPIKWVRNMTKCRLLTYTLCIAVWRGGAEFKNNIQQTRFSKPHRTCCLLLLITTFCHEDKLIFFVLLWWTSVALWRTQLNKLELQN